jgi:hypothetical protein
MPEQNGTTTSQSTYFTRSFSSFSGADIKVIFANIEIATLQAISYAIQREKAPVYTLGDPNPRAFSRGKRGIAGSMIFIMFDTHALLDAFRDAGQERLAKFVKDTNEIDPTKLSLGQDFDINPVADADQFWNSYEVADAFYVDQIPPFDITITAVNETAGGAIMRIWSAEIMNEGYGISVDDMVSEMQCTYVCRMITRWRRAKDASNGRFPFSAVKDGPGVAIQGPKANSSTI